MSNSPPNAKSRSRRRSNAIWRPRRVRPRRCSTISTPNSRAPMPASGRSSPEAPMPEVTLVEAVNLALARAMEEDANVVVLGEDVGVNGGVFRATVGLQQRFGSERVIDTPLSELLISWGAAVKETLAAADELTAQGIEAEVIDLATLKPYDEETVLASVMRTGRCVIVHEAARTGGFSAEIAALLAERGLTSLLAPVARVTGYDTIMPLPRLEQRYIPSVSRIVAATRKVCEFA